MGQGIDLDLVPFIPPSEIGNVFDAPIFLQGLKELEQRLLRRIAPHYEIDEGIVSQDLFMIVSG